MSLGGTIETSESVFTRAAIALITIFVLAVSFHVHAPSANARTATATGKSEQGAKFTLGWSVGAASAISAHSVTSVASNHSYESNVTASGMQTLIHIESPEAPKRFEFPLDLPEGAEVLPFNDGSSSIYGIFKNGDLLATVEQPWAVDASGEDIRTDLKIEGNSLVQTVDHNSSFEYPITADPEVDWGWEQTTIRLSWNETRSTGAVTGAGGLAALPWLAVAGVSGGVIGVALALAWARLAHDALRATHRNKCLGIVANSNPFSSNVGISTFEYSCR
ncbi:putative uncharacterized protein [Corynebacterium casei UCMA 3821]|uniref:Uncharacterized protein n=2 Tax=Corynebacteriaceae TaxID=1653 RepID=G7HY41_9CORY|nr:putative uncharacterized protein [Corynebacterium casei UCMA 3821]